MSNARKQFIIMHIQLVVELKQCFENFEIMFKQLF